MPLGNLTSQFFANVYLHELDYFIKNILKVKFYIRYVDDFVILHHSRKQLEIWKKQIDEFLLRELRLELHAQKSRVIPVARGIDFVGFRNFCRYSVLRNRSLQKMKKNVRLFEKSLIDFRFLSESFQGWQAHASWADTRKLRLRTKEKIIEVVWKKV